MVRCWARWRFSTGDSAKLRSPKSPLVTIMEPRPVGGIVGHNLPRMVVSRLLAAIVSWLALISS